MQRALEVTLSPGGTNKKEDVGSRDPGCWEQLCTGVACGLQLWVQGYSYSLSQKTREEQRKSKEIGFIFKSMIQKLHGFKCSNPTDSNLVTWIESRKRRGWQRTRWLDSITNSMDMSLSKLWEMWRTGKPGVLQSMGSRGVRHDFVTEQHAREVWKM